MVKKVLSVILCVVLCFTMQTVMFAKTVGGSAIISPMFVNVNSVSASLAFSGDTAYITGMVTGSSGVTKITANVMLQRKNGSTWENVTSWSSTTNSSTMIISKSATATKGYTYRARLDVTATAGNTSENITQYSKEVSH